MYEGLKYKACLKWSIILTHVGKTQANIFSLVFFFFLSQEVTAVQPASLILFIAASFKLFSGDLGATGLWIWQTKAKPNRQRGINGSILSSCHLNHISLYGIIMWQIWWSYNLFENVTFVLRNRITWCGCISKGLWEQETGIIVGSYQTLSNKRC